MSTVRTNSKPRHIVKRCQACWKRLFGRQRQFCSAHCRRVYFNVEVKKVGFYPNRKCLVCGKVGDWYCIAHRKWKNKMVETHMEASLGITTGATKL